MALFKKLGRAHGYGALVDIGSGSVLVAIVHSDPAQPHPHIIWSHREHAALKNIDSLEQSAKAVMSALVSAGMILDGEGRKALFEHNKDARITALQCSIAAPWSYTVTKTVTYEREDGFTVTDELINELTETVRGRIRTDLEQNEALQDLELTVIAQGTMDQIVNGYRVDHPEGQTAQQIRLSHGNAVAQRYLIEAIADVRDKLFPAAETRNLSFILMMFLVTRELLPHTYDSCLLDVTYEATEIGIVRDGSLTYCTHTPFGAFSLAREIAEITKVPLHEAFGYLHSAQPFQFLDSLSKPKRTDVETVLDNYCDRVAELFHQTGDDLTIPKHIAIHTDIEMEPLFTELITRAAKRTTKVAPRITRMSKEIIKQTYADSTDTVPKSMPQDTALLLSAQFFHTREQHDSFVFE